jgi:hypothetical protein
VLLLLIIAGGAGLWGRGGRDEPTPAVPHARAVASRKEAVSGDTDAAPAPPPSDATTADRERSEATLLRRALEAGDLGRAWRLYDAAAARSDKQSLATELQQATAAAVGELGHRIERGEVLAARATLQRWRGAPHDRVAAAVRAMTVARGWWDVWDPPPAAPQATLAPPPPLAAERGVRAVFRGAILSGVVAPEPGGAQLPDRVCVRIRDAGGVLHPELERTEVEPIDPAAGEVEAQLRSALRAGDRDLVALWAAHAAARGVPLSADVAALLAVRGR